MLLIDMLGRRFEAVDRSFPDVTVVGYDVKANRLRLHVLGGDRQTVDLDLFERAYREGKVLEAKAAPFVHDRITKFHARRAALRTYVAGPNKQPMRGFQIIEGGK